MRRRSRTAPPHPLQEDDPLPLLEMPLADQVDQLRRTLCRMDRVKQDALKLGERGQRLHSTDSGDALTFAWVSQTLAGTRSCQASLRT